MSRPARRSALILTLPLLLFACGQPTGSSASDPYAAGKFYPWSDRLGSPGADPYADGRSYAWTGPTAGGGLNAQGLMGENFLSDLTWTSATNAWGAVEKDRSNGDQATGDGKTLTLGGQTFAKGLGVHANSTVSYALGGSCQTFRASVGIDDEVGNQGSAVFQVYADGVKLFDSGVLRGVDFARPISVDMTGKNELKLVVTSGGDNINYDHADWAGARVSCTAPAPTQDSFVSDLAPSSATNGWGPFEKDRSNGGQALGDGKPLTLNGQAYPKGLGVHANSVLTYSLGGRCTVFSTRMGLDDEVGDQGSVVFQVFGDGIKLYDGSNYGGVMRGTSPDRSASINVTSVNELKLVVTDGGDNINYDHADWVNAKLTCLTSAPSSGILDTSFSGDGRVETGGRDAVLEADGNIVLLGSDFSVTRLNNSGSVIGRSAANLGSASFANGLALQADGKLVAVGSADDHFAVVRFNRDLTLDTTFDGDGVVLAELSDPGNDPYGTAPYDVARDVAVQPDGKIVVVGRANRPWRSDYPQKTAPDIAALRLNPNGSRDTTFGQSGVAYAGWEQTSSLEYRGDLSEDGANAVAVLSDGRIMLATQRGNYGYADGGLVCLLPDGRLNSSFGQGGRLFTGLPHAVRALPDGGFITVGARSRYSVYGLVQRYTVNGALLSEREFQYTLDAFAPHPFSAVAVQRDGKFVVGGDGVVVRFNTDLTPDTSFGNRGTGSSDVSNGGVRAVLVQGDGRIVAANSVRTGAYPYYTEQRQVDVDTVRLLP